MTVQFGLGFGQDQDVYTVGEYAKRSEDLGFTHITVADINNLANEATVLMTLATMATDRIRIGHGVTNPATMHSGAIANAMASIRELGGDRAFIGIGAGGPYGQFLHRGVKMQTLRNSIAFMREYSAGRDGQLEDGGWHSEWIRNSSRYNGSHVPCWVAVAGPKTCQIAGEVGDGVLSIGMDPVLQQWRKDQVAVGSKKAGRNEHEVEFYIRTQLYIAESKSAAKRELEPYAATCTYELYQILRRDTPEVNDLCERLEKHHPGLLEEFRMIFDNYDPYWTERIGGPQTKFVTQRVIDFFLANGSSEDICEQIAALEPVGVTGISSVLFSIEKDFEMMQRIADEIMVNFR